MFSIPWKHAARHGWELEKDASLFKMWAVHTGESTYAHNAKTARSAARSSFWLNKMYSAGKYQEGQNSDPKTWKANFRCAMNSLPDIEEVKDRSINKGHQAVRVFKMLPCTPKSKGEATDRKWSDVKQCATASCCFFFFWAVIDVIKWSKCLCFIPSVKQSKAKDSKRRRKVNITSLSYFLQVFNFIHLLHLKWHYTLTSMVWKPQPD